MRRTLILPLLLMFLSAAASYAYGQSNQAFKKWWKEPEVAAELQLTTDQVNKIEEIFTANKEKLEQAYVEFKHKQAQLKGAIDSPDSTKEDVLKLTDEVEAVKGTWRKSKITMFLDIKEVLNPEQRSKLAKLKDKFKKQSESEPNQSETAQPEPQPEQQQ